MADMKVSYCGLAIVLVAMLPSLLFAEEEGLSLYDPGPTATKLKEAAMHGNVEAMSRLAGAHQSNDGANRISFLKEDRESAYIWFSISASFQPDSEDRRNDHYNCIQIEAGPAGEPENRMSLKEATKLKEEARKLANQIESISGKKILWPDAFIPMHLNPYMGGLSNMGRESLRMRISKEIVARNLSITRHGPDSVEDVASFREIYGDKLPAPQ